MRFFPARRTQALAVLVSSCALSVAAPAEEPDHRAEGEKVAGRLFAVLVTALQSKLSSGPPEDAVAFCRLEALPLTAKAGGEFPHVSSVRRTALRVRNPANQPDATDRRVLESFEKAWNPATPPQPVVEEAMREDGTREIRFYKPVPTMASCLACHGPEPALTAPVRAALAKDYPEDRATGFAEGDLRGAIVVTFPAP